MTKRFAWHSGSMGDVSTAAGMGCCEFGYVYDWSGSDSDGVPSCASIHSAGMTATLNLMNDASHPQNDINASGATFAGYFQAVKSAGWDQISGEGTGGSVVSTAMNYLPYINYGGDEQQNMYVSPWNHPTSGGHGHWDYIETYTAGSPSEVENVGGVEGVINAAKSAGAGHLGILIAGWASAGADTYQGIMDACGCDTACVWVGYGNSAAGTSGASALQSLISHYGAAKGGAPTTSGGGGTTAAAKTLVIQCPCRHIWLSFKGVNGNSTSEKIEFKVLMQGRAGWVDNNDKQIPNKPYTGKLQLWARNAKKTWAIQEFWPAKDGTFAIWIGSDTAETRYYNVRFADSGSSPPYQQVWE